MEAAGSSLGTGHILLSHAPSPAPGGAPGSREIQARIPIPELPARLGVTESLVVQGGWGLGEAEIFLESGNDAEHPWRLHLTQGERNPPSAVGIVALDGSLAQPSMGKRPPRKNGAFFWETKTIPKSPWRTRAPWGERVPSARIPNIRDPKEQGHLGCDELCWTQAPAAPWAPGFGKSIPKT